MQILFSQAMLKTIESHIQEARGTRAILDVYRIAEIIRVKHIDDNVALEDIIEKIVLNAGAGIPVEFNMPELDSDAVGEGVNGSTVELLMEVEKSIH